MRSGREIALGPLSAAAGAVVLIVSLFLDWYDELSAFTVFEVLDLVLLGLAIASLLSLAQHLGLRLPGGRALGAGAALPLGLIAFAIVVSQLLNHPPAAVDRQPELGLWLGLGGSALLVGGALLTAARISLAIDVERRAGASRAGRSEDSGERPSQADPDAPTVAERPGPERRG